MPLDAETDERELSPASLRENADLDAEIDDDDDEGVGSGAGGRGGSRERRKIEIKFIANKARRHITFSKRKHGIMKKAWELSVLTGTQVLLLVVSETGLVYTFTTPKLQPLVTQSEGKSLIQSCLNAPENPPEPETQRPLGQSNDKDVEHSASPDGKSPQIRPEQLRAPPLIQPMAPIPPQGPPPPLSVPPAGAQPILPPALPLNMPQGLQPMPDYLMHNSPASGVPQAGLYPFVPPGFQVQPELAAYLQRQQPQVPPEYSFVPQGIPQGQPQPPLPPPQRHQQQQQPQPPPPPQNPRS